MKKTIITCDRCFRPIDKAAVLEVDLLPDGMPHATKMDLCAPCRVSFLDLFNSWKDQMK